MAKKFSFTLVALVVALLIGVALRTFHLASIPAAMSHDEIDYVLNGKFIALTGSDITGTWNILSLKPIYTETVTAELTAALYAPFFKIPGMPLTLTTAKIVPVIFSLSLILLVFALTEVLTKNRTLAVVAAFVTAVNPWSIIFAHTAFEAPLSLAFFLLSFVCLFSLSAKRRLATNITLFLVACAGAFMSFFTYNGYKVVIPFYGAFLLMWQVWMYRRENKKSPSLSRKKLTAFFVIFCLVCFGLFGITLLRAKDIYQARAGEILPLNNVAIKQLVDSQRLLTLHTPLTGLFENKFTTIGWEALLRYTSAWDFRHLFLTGEDGSVQFSIWYHGYFYLGEIVFLGIGAFFFYRRYKPAFWWLLGIALIAPLPAAIHTEYSSTVRAAFFIPVFLVLISGGIYASVQFFSTRRKKILAAGAIGAFYSISILYFLFIYAYRYPVYAADHYFFSERLFSHALTFVPPTQNVVVLTKDPYGLLSTYVFYHPQVLNDPDTVRTLQGIFKSGTGAQPFHFRNFTFTNTCVTAQTASVLIAEPNLKQECQLPLLDSAKDYESIASPIDSGDYYFMINSPICTDHSRLQPFIHHEDEAAFKVEKLDESTFCQDWVLLHKGSGGTATLVPQVSTPNPASNKK